MRSLIAVLFACSVCLLTACDPENDDTQPGDDDDEAVCGDGSCAQGEDCESCPDDCGDCEPECGDGSCHGDEDCDSCPEDCGECAAECGDGTCDEDEDCDSCSEDCGECEPECGDDVCDDTEWCDTCPEDCGECGEEDCGYQPHGVDGPATLPGDETDTTLLDTTGWTAFTVRSSGGDFTGVQAAYDAAVIAGGPVVIEVEAGHDAGDLMLTDRLGQTDWIYIQPDAVAELPAERRATREDAEHMYLLRGVLSGASWTEPVGVEPGGGYTRIIGADISVPDDATPRSRSHIVRLRADGNGTLGDPTDADDMPTHVILDRVYVHIPVDGTRFAAYLIGLNGRHLAVVDSYVVGAGRGYEATKAINSGYGDGPVLVQNNYLASDGINVFFGGEVEQVDWKPSDITIRGNHVHKPAEWYGSEHVLVKNSFEIKNARRVLVERNLFENNWVDAQSGWMILLRAESTDGVCEDITFRFNHLSNSPGGWNIVGRDEYAAAHPTRRVSIHDNLHTRFCGNTDFGAPGHQIRLDTSAEWPITDLWFTHNTFDDLGGQGALMSLSPGEAGGDFVFRDNIHPHGAYGVKTDGIVEGTESLDATFGAGGYTFDFNVSGDCNDSYYPPGDNVYPSWGTLETQFVDAANGDLELIETSAYRDDGLYPPYDQEMRGADIACLNVLLEGVDTGVHGE